MHDSIDANIIMDIEGKAQPVPKEDNNNMLVGIYFDPFLAPDHILRTTYMNT